MSQAPTFFARLRQAGVSPADPEDLRIRKSVLVFAMGLMTAAPMLWLALYWMMGQSLSATLPLAYQLFSVATFLIYVQTGNFGFFRYIQLGLFLFFPFVVQLVIGNFISASGVVLWGILAPVVAVLVLSGRESIPWFVAYIALLLMCGYVDFELAAAAAPKPAIPLRTSATFFVLNFMAVSGIVYFLLRYEAREKDRYETRLVDAHRLLMAEQQNSERLLLNVLPPSVAARLKESDKTIADGFADVTVMFADIVNFTSMAATMSPGQIFAMLNKLFSAFDALAEKHGLEKIKTIGDAYMVAGGLTDGTGGRYTQATANMALDMLALMASDRSVNSLNLAIRIGIATGPIVAGVVGTKKFIYDLWGDTVNLASRISTEGAPGVIQVDATTQRRLRASHLFEGPQTVLLKGKGDTPVYRLLGQIAGEPPPGGKTLGEG